MFVNKKEAEEHDKMLELAENITALIESNIDGIDEQHSEVIGVLLSRHREHLAKVCKGKPEALLDLEVKEEAKISDTHTTAIAAGGSSQINFDLFQRVPDAVIKINLYTAAVKSLRCYHVQRNPHKKSTDRR
jgi:dsDNA-binding SOS-regulon protein